METTKKAATEKATTEAAEQETTLTETTGTKEVAVAADPIFGFEETRIEDIIVPRIKVINALSPERIDGEAVEGDIINSLTKENMTGKKLVLVKQYYSNIEWNPDRKAEDRMLCRAADGKIGEDVAGITYACSACPKNKFDNTKKGKDSQPTCTSYINFLGFFEDDFMPVVVSFAKTNYNEGKKMLSIAKSLRSNIWDFSYSIVGKKVTKDNNVWYIMIPTLEEETSAMARTFAKQLHAEYLAREVMTNYEDAGKYEGSAEEVDTTGAEM